MSSPQVDLYKTLGVDKNADAATIKTSYRKLILKCHPDKIQDPAQKAIKQDEFQRVQQAYETLSDEVKRAEYDIKRKRREDAARNLNRPSSHASPKVYTEYNVRTAEPPSSFKPGPPPTPFSPYAAAGSPRFSSSWDRDVPYRPSKPAAYEEVRRARRTESYEKEKPREDPKDERKRRKEEDDPPFPHFREPSYEKDRDREREKERERDRKSRSDREREEKRDRYKKENEKRDKDRDRARRQEQQDKFRTSKQPYAERYDESDEERRLPKKKSSMGGSSKKAAEAPRRDKSAPQDSSPRTAAAEDTVSEQMRRAANYMSTVRQSNKSAMPGSHYPEDDVVSPRFLNTDSSWPPTADPLRARRTSQEDKKFRPGKDTGEDINAFMGSPDGRPPPLKKSYTSPPGAVHMSAVPSQRVPNLGRSATMEYTRRTPQSAPVPPPDSSRSKPDRRRRDSFDAYENDTRRATVPSHGTYPHANDGSPLPRSMKSSSYYRSADGSYYAPAFGGSTGRVSYAKIKTNPNLHEQPSYAKRFSDDDVSYSPINHSVETPTYATYV